MPTALITGASSGIGYAFAYALASKGMNLILVARSEDKLNALAQTLMDEWKIDARAIAQDLTKPDAAVTVADAVAAQGLTVDMLINNAGFGDYGAFSDRPRQRHLDMIQLNIAALVDLTYQFLPGMQHRRSGTIINIASIAGFQSMPYLSVYAATKAFVLSFTEALWAETKPYNIRVIVSCPGPTETRFFQEAQFPETMRSVSPGQVIQPETIVQDVLDELDSDIPTIVSGGVLSKVVVNLSRFLPRPTMVNIIEKQFRPRTEENNG
ncbi:MAG: SDR family oxidoreductase [Leptolyngbyaceae bacterium]|nr:SDR family oxidoreductase [Leptolyngbyaceae bacterium]